MRTVPPRTPSSPISPSNSERDPTFGEQCVCYTPHLRRWARRLAPDRPTAEDLLQDTILCALANQHRFTPGSNLRAWLFTIMHNKRVNGVRRARRWGEPVDPLAADAVSISGEQEINQEIQELRRGLENLPKDRREILLLAHFHEHSYAEISRMLHIPVGTVQSRLTRARALLRRAIEGPKKKMRTTRV